LADISNAPPASMVYLTIIKKEDEAEGRVS